MLLIKAIAEWIGSYAAIVLSLASGKMMEADNSDLPPHLR